MLWLQDGGQVRLAGSASMDGFVSQDVYYSGIQVRSESSNKRMFVFCIEYTEAICALKNKHCVLEHTGHEVSEPRNVFWRLLCLLVQLNTDPKS